LHTAYAFPLSAIHPRLSRIEDLCSHFSPLIWKAAMAGRLPGQSNGNAGQKSFEPGGSDENSARVTGR
jgi:hypothetical protein